jgi:hypothetical protein
MALNIAAYEKVRAKLTCDNGKFLDDLERSVTLRVLKGLCRRALAIKRDFDTAIVLRPFWEKYAPLQRGHKPRGEAFPWGEVGEKVVEGHLYSVLPAVFGEIRFPGLPYGHDVRFLTSEALIQIDAKSTGPTDNPNEVVSSPNQVTGEGKLEDLLVTNATVRVTGERSSIDFRPELPPFYILDGRVYPCLTYYVKVVYAVLAKGDQPLSYLELICVPNGLLMFDGPKFGTHRGLLIPGKDEVHYLRKRTRIRLDPLAAIASWRCILIKFEAETFQVLPRQGKLAQEFLESTEP